MSKHHRTAGTEFTVVEIKGKRFTMRPLTVGQYAELESHIVSLRGDALAIASEAVKKLPESHHEAIWKAAMREAVASRTVTMKEANDYQNSLDGLAWMVWQCVKQDHPEIDSLTAARELVMSAGPEEFKRIALATEVASGEADLKKSSGQADTADEAPAGPSSTES